MEKSIKRNILLVTIIISLAIVFVPIYFFVLADSTDDNKFRVINTKITDMLDGTAGFDSDDNTGNDSSATNSRVRTFDKITYTVTYTLEVKPNETTSQSIESRDLFVEVLVPVGYEANLMYGETTNIAMNDEYQDKVFNDSYYYGSFYVTVPASAIGTPSTFSFSLSNINSTDISQYNSIKPLVFIKESTDETVQSVKNVSTLPTEVPTELTRNVTDPSTGTTTTETIVDCSVAVTGVEDYFVNLYLGNKKSGDDRTVPVGMIIGLREREGKGIKGLIVPNSLTFNISANSSKLSFNENSFMSYRTYQADTDYLININELGTQMPQLENGTINGVINNDNTVTITLSNIKDYLITEGYGLHYFSTDYFLTTLEERQSHDYSDINIDLTANKSNSNNEPSQIRIVDSYDYIVGNYSSNIDVYGSDMLNDNQNQNPKLEYGKAIVNYGADYILKTEFGYSSRSNSSGAGLTSLTNYIKIDNDVFKLINNKTTNKGYNFIPSEVTSISRMKLDTEEVGGNAHEKVLFGFGEWTSDYFELTSGSDCPSDISILTKEELMNLYGGPCLVEKNTVKWAYSPVAENDIDGNELNFNKGPLIVKSTYVSGSSQTPYIDPGSSGTFELYGTVVDDSSIANSSHQVVTCATAYGRSATDFRYLGNESITGETLLANKNNFNKTVYDFNNRNIISLNTNLCNGAEPNKCPASGATILISGITSTSPVIKSYKATNLDTQVTEFYYYPMALKINASAAKSDEDLRFNTIYVDVYLPDYMEIDDNYGTPKNPILDSNSPKLSTLRTKFNKAPLEVGEIDYDYKLYHYILTAESEGLTEDDISNLQRGILSNLTIYADIDLITTPNASKPEIYTVVDFEAVKHLTNNGNVSTISFRPITSETDRYACLDNITLYNSSAVTTKATATPNNIEKNGSYTFNMIAYNHSSSVIQDEVGGYIYPEADLYYVLPYDNDLGSSEFSSKIGTTTYKVNFTSESINSIVNPSDYKFYYMKGTSGVNKTKIISDEIKTTSDPNVNWVEWVDPTIAVSDVVAIKVVKQSPFEIDTYFASSSGLTVNVETVGSSDGNTYYNSFHILAVKPQNFNCDTIVEETGQDYCTEAKQTKANYTSSSSKTSVYERVISGFVFEDYDYNGIYTNEESKLKDIPVSLYKIGTLPETYDPIDPTTFVSETDTLISSTVTGENGNYYFGGLSSGNYYVSYTIDNNKYIVTDLKKHDSNIPDSDNNNSSASLIPNTNKAVSEVITFPEEGSSGKLIVGNVNLGLTIKKEMAVSLNKYITEVDVTKNGKTDIYDYANQNATQVSITVLNPKDTHVTVKYSFVVENTKYYPGYIGMIVDSMPSGMTFNPNLKENQYWVMYDNLLYYNGLSGKLLLPNEKQYFTLILDLDLKAAGTYRNIVSARDITLMGDELPVYDFSGLNNTSTTNIEGGE